MLKVIENAKSSPATTPWTTYQIPVLIYEALSNWQAPYSTAAIMVCIKTVLRIDFADPATLTADTYQRVYNIRTFIHSLGFKNPQQWQKQYLLSQFFGKEIKLVKRSEAFKELDKALEELLKELAPVCNAPSATDNWLATGTNYAFNAIGQLCNLVIKVNATPNLMYKFFVSAQLMMYFAQGVEGQSNDNTTSLTLQELALSDVDSTTADHPFAQHVDAIEFHTTANFAAADDIHIKLSKHEQATLIEKANKLLDSRQFDEALKIAEQITNSNTNGPEIYFIKGSVALEKDHDYTQAAEYYAKACKINPDNAKYQLFHKTAQYFNTPQNTLKHYVDKVTFDPLTLATERFMPDEKLFCMASENNFIARSCHTAFNKNQVNKLFKKADYAHREGNLIEALEHYNGILAIIPHDDPYYNPQLQYLYWQKSLIHFSRLQYQQAKQALESVMIVATKPAMLVDVYFQYGTTLLNIFYHAPDLKILEKAVISYQKVNQLEPDNQAFQAIHAETRALYEDTSTRMEQQRYRM